MHAVVGPTIPCMLPFQYKSDNLATCYKLKKSNTVISFLGPTLPAVFTFFCLVCGFLLGKKRGGRELTTEIHGKENHEES